MITKNTITIVPWMTELWVWADKFEISEEALPRNREGLLTITNLVICSKQLTELPESIGQLTKLRRLVVSKNQIDRLPDSIGQLINLECLDISDNPLTTLPESIIQLKKLEFITIAEDITTNKLVDLSAEVTDFLRGLRHGCKGWSDTIKPKRRTSIQEYLQRQKSLINDGIIASKNVDRAALQTVLDWAESFAVSNIQTDIDKLANQNALSIDSYTKPIPAAIGYLTQLRSLILRDSMSSNDRVCQADDKLPDSIINLVNLETLSLVCKDAVFIPADLYELKNLKTLEITFHELNAIPKVLTAMSCDIKLLIHSKQDRLPDNLVDISSLTELSIYNDCLTELPESISRLEKLKELTINSSHLKKIPQDIGNLVDLTHLRLNCEKLECLPESLKQLTSLCGLNIPNQLTDQLPINLIKRYRDNELWITNISSITLYESLTDSYRLSAFGFFLVKEDWVESELIDLKEKTAPEFLFGLQTTEKTIKQFDVVDGIIICQPDEIQKVMKMFETAFYLPSIGVNYVGIHYDDLRDTLSFKRPAKFIQSSVVKLSELDIALSQIVSQISKEINIKSFIFNFEGSRHPSFEEWDKITVSIEGKVLDEKNLFFHAEITDELDQCWMGAIYVAS